MSYFFITLVTVAVMLLYAVPGYLMIKVKAVKQESIPAFATLLMYVSQPCLMLYSFQRVEASLPLVQNMVLFFCTTLLLQLIIMGAFFFCIRKKKEDVRYRICTVASVFGNCAFLGVPLLEALLPEYPEAIVFSNMFAVSMNLIGWTFGSYVISLDRRYISIKKLILNPAVLACLVAIPLFAFHITLPDQLYRVVELLGRMTTPLCMLVMGMRLATIPLKRLFDKPFLYAMIGFKQILFPLIVFLIAFLLPVEQNIKITLFILSCAPVASVVLNFAELIGEGQDTAANLVLLGTMASVLTIPVMSLLIPLL
ncbi:MAG: AEC family transporter [Clostridia bacterium]|nr:AEC family transporter [Clostridia bacterium]